MSKKISFPFIGFLIVLLLATSVSCIAYFNIILPADSFHWDESHHGIYGVWLARDIKLGNWGNFWKDTHRQTLWPFFHSWILTVFFLIFGVSFQIARFSSLVIFFVTAVLVYLLSNRFLEKKYGWQTGILASLLTLISPIMIKFATENMLEGIGALVFISSIYVYFLSEEKKKWHLYIALGVLLGISVVTKYNYAYLILTSFAVVILSEVFNVLKIAQESVAKTEEKSKRLIEIIKSSSFSHWIYKNLLIPAPALLISLSWFFSGDSGKKIQMLMWSKQVVAGRQGQLAGLFNNILFYPKAIINSYCFSPWLGFLIVLSIFIPIAFSKIRNLNKLYLFVWTCLFLSIFTIGNKMVRLIYIFIPIIFIIFSSNIFYFIEKIRTLENKRKILASVLFIIVFIPSLFSLGRIPKALKFGEERKPEKIINVLEFFRDNIPKNKSFSTGISISRMSPYVFYFYFHDWKAPFFTLFQARDPNFYRTEYLPAIEFTEDSPYKESVIDNSIENWNALIEANVKENKLELFKEKAFEKIGITAKIYKVKPAK